MRIESGTAIGDQTKTVNLFKTDQVAERSRDSASVVDRSSSRSGDGKSEQPNIAEQPLAELLKKTEYDISFQLSFTVHKETKSLVVKVIDPDTNKVVREIPPEELLDLAAKIQEMLGFLIDKKV